MKSLKFRVWPAPGLRTSSKRIEDEPTRFAGVGREESYLSLPTRRATTAHDAGNGKNGHAVRIEAANGGCQTVQFVPKEHRVPPPRASVRFAYRRTPVGMTSFLD